MTSVAVISVPTAQAADVYARIGGGGWPIPERRADHVSRRYFCVPLSILACTGIFAMPDVEVQYFETQAEAFEWADADVWRRMADQKATMREAVFEGLRQRGRR